MNQKVNIEFPNNIELYIKREDLLHPLISGNKFRKLKYNIEVAKKLNKEVLITFGGAYSNHILATAAAGNEYNFKTIGVIRGEEIACKIDENPTLIKAKSLGMKFLFLDRIEYSKKEASVVFQKELSKISDTYYVLPEGGTNSLAIKGCEEILSQEDFDFSHICCSVGTGGTISGIINSSQSHQKILGFSALKGTFLKEDICNFVTKENWDLITDYHFGGYAKTTSELISFLNHFYNQTKIPLDPIYTGKMTFGVQDLIKKDFFPKNSKILLIHTGGLQGIYGMNKYLQLKNMELINYEK